MKWSIVSCFLALSLSLGLPAMGAAHDEHVHTNHGITVPPAVHGMVIFGNETLYASHIPMFMVPHDWQAHFEIRLEHKTIDANTVVKSLSGGQSVQKLYTFAPKPFVLPDLLNGTISQFSGDLFEGNFEAGGKVILKDVTVHVTKTMNVSQLKPTTAAIAHITYVPFDSSERSFLAHKIAAPSSFDQIVEIRWIKSLTSMPNEFALELSDELENRLTAGQLFKIVDNKLEPATLSEEADLEVVGEFSCTIGPDFFEACE